MKPAEYHRFVVHEGPWAAQNNRPYWTRAAVLDGYEIAREIIQDELGATPEDLFLNIDHVTLAAASTAQIHRATLPTTEEVVVKVQRPDIDVTVRGDLNVMADVVATLKSRHGG